MHAAWWLAIIGTAVAVVAFAVWRRHPHRPFNHTADWYSLAGAVAILAGLVAGVGVGSGLGYQINRSECGQKADGLDTDFRYGLLAGCRFETDDGRFVPEDNWRLTEDGGVSDDDG